MGGSHSYAQPLASAFQLNESIQPIDSWGRSSQVWCYQFKVSALADARIGAVRCTVTEHQFRARAVRRTAGTKNARSRNSPPTPDDIWSRLSPKDRARITQYQYGTTSIRSTATASWFPKTLWKLTSSYYWSLGLICKTTASAPSRFSAGMYRRISLAGLICIYLAGRTKAHEHHGENIPDGEAVSAEPIVSGSLETYLGCAGDDC